MSGIYNHNPLVYAPGWQNSRFNARQILTIGARLRDEDLRKYPLLPEALKVGGELASSREWRIITTKMNARGAGRAIDYLNNARTINYWDSTIDLGFPQFLRRRYIDYNTIGRTLAYWDVGKPLEYLDPAFCHFYTNPNREWQYFNNQKYPESQVWVHHPIPKGGYGFWTSPLESLIPTAMLAYLIREHDLAQADGRKVREIMVVGAQQAAQDVVDAVNQMIEAHDKPNTESNNIPVVYVETNGSLPVKDLFHKLGIANIPDGFDRQRFDFYYANQIAAALGLALRHFWSKDEFTNRSIEEINEQRQVVKGPNIFIRSEQEMVNRSGMLRQFGPNLRFEFIEEVDVATRQARAKVLLDFSQAVSNLLKLNDEAFTMETAIAWGVREGIIPSDINLLTSQHIEESDAVKSAELGYGEVAYNQDGFIVDYRPKSYHITEEIREEIRLEKVAQPEEVDFVGESRKFNAKLFLEKAIGDEDVIDLYNKVYNSYEALSHEEHYAIYQYVYEDKD